MLIAHVGADTLAEQALKPLREIEVDLKYVNAIEGKPTGVSMITVPPDGKKGIILAGNANNIWTKEDITAVRDAIAKAPSGSVLVVDYEIAPFIVEPAINAACERDFPVILDPSPADRVEQNLFSQVTYLVPDAGEAEKLSGIKINSVDCAIQAAHHFLDRGVKNACVKLKDGGCVLINHEQTLHIPPVPVDVVDATGAGDAFAGALAVAVLEKRSLQDAACFATAAWHGEDYRGHIFWDETFVLPFLACRFPEIARSMLLYRYRRLGAAKILARQHGYKGAMFPWRSASTGREETPRFQFS